jgi:hypothetical protein
LPAGSISSVRRGQQTLPIRDLLGSSAAFLGLACIGSAGPSQATKFSRTVATGSVQHVVPFQAASRSGSKVEIGSLSRHPEQLFGSRRWPSHRAGNTNGMEHRRQRARFVKGNAPSIKEGYIKGGYYASQAFGHCQCRRFDDGGHGCVGSK